MKTKVDNRLVDRQVVSNYRMIENNLVQSFLYAVETIGKDQAIELMKKALKEHKQLQKKVG